MPLAMVWLSNLLVFDIAWSSLNARKYHPSKELNWEKGLSLKLLNYHIDLIWRINFKFQNRWLSKEVTNPSPLFLQIFCQTVIQSFCQTFKSENFIFVFNLWIYKCFLVIIFFTGKQMFYPDLKKYTIYLFNFILETYD